MSLNPSAEPLVNSFYLADARQAQKNTQAGSQQAGGSVAHWLLQLSAFLHGLGGTPHLHDHPRIVIYASHWHHFWHCVPHTVVAGHL